MTSSFCLLSNVDMGLAASAVLPLSGDRFSQRDLFCGRLLRPTGVCTPLRAKASSTRISSLCNFYCVSLQVHVCYKKPAQERRKASRHLRFLRHVVYPTPSVDQPALTQAHKPTAGLPLTAPDLFISDLLSPRGSCGARQACTKGLTSTCFHSNVGSRTPPPCAS